MYKDKDRQREYQKQWVRQKRALQGSTQQGSTRFNAGELSPPSELRGDDDVSAQSIVARAKKNGVTIGQQHTHEQGIAEQPKPQSYNPMMVGYVPKRGGACEVPKPPRAGAE